MELIPEFRYYFSDPAATKRGFYIAPHGLYRQMKDDNFPRYESKTYGAGVYFGYQYVYHGRLCIDFFLGPDYATGELEKKDFEGVDEGIQLSIIEEDYPRYAGVLFNVGFRLGIAF